MTRYLLNRLAFSVAIMLAMITILFFTMRVSGDPRMLMVDEYTTQEHWDNLGEKLGVDRPLIFQYVSWIAFVAKGDFGASLRLKVSALDKAVGAIAGTLKLVLGGAIASIIFTALTVAIVARRRGPKLEYAVNLFKKIAPAVPIFLVGILLFQVFGVKAGWISIVAQRGGIERYTLASATLGIFVAYGMVRILVPVVMQAMNAGSAQKSVESWIRVVKVASLKLLAPSHSHVLAAFTAVIITEIMFDLPGLVSTTWEARRFLDGPLFLSALMFLTVAYAAALFTADVVRAFLDPRILHGAPAADNADGAEAGEGSTAIEGRTSKSWPVFGRRPMIPASILFVVALLAIFGPLIAPHSTDTDSIVPDASPVPPIWLEGGRSSNFLGTDRVGRDLLSLIIDGARYSLTIAAGTLVIAASASLIAVSVAAYLGGLADRVLMWVIDFTSAIPIVLAGYGFAFFIFFFGGWWAFGAFAGILALLVWRNFVQRLRAELLRAQSDEQISCLKSIGNDKRELLSAYVHYFRPRLPMIILTLAALNAGSVVIMESILSFLGITYYFGFISPWGLIARQSMGPLSPWWPALFPGIAIVLTVLSLNFLGVWLRERLDPPLSHQQDGAAEVFA